jgi:MFS family permease
MDSKFMKPRLTLVLLTNKISLIVSAFAFLSPLSSSIAAPALKPIAKDLNIPESSSQLSMVLSIFLLAYALGPFVLSPCSEIWGRIRIIRLGNIVFIVFTALCGWAQSKEQITAFRFFAGLGGSATMGVCPQFLFAKIVLD